MKLHINNRLRLRDLQSEFTTYFPNLKIEFYTLPHVKFSDPNARFRLSPDAIVAYCRDVDREGELFISEEERVCELEQELSLRFGLHAEVFAINKKAYIKSKNINANYSLATCNSRDIAA